jgi:hypothetical protein
MTLLYSAIAAQTPTLNGSLAELDDCLARLREKEWYSGGMW